MYIKFKRGVALASLGVVSAFCVGIGGEDGYYN